MEGSEWPDQYYSMGKALKLVPLLLKEGFMPKKSKQTHFFNLMIHTLDFCYVHSDHFVIMQLILEKNSFVIVISFGE